MGSFTADTNISHVIDQSGLSTPYASGITPSATYTATHDSMGGNIWYSNFNATTGNVDFDLGQSRLLSAFLFWNIDPTNSFRVTTFSLSASDTADFSSATSLGSFTTATTGVPSAVNKETFSFASTSARYVRMTITGNGGGRFTGFGEAAFVSAAAAAPEPGTIALLLTAGVPAIGLVRRRKVSRQSA